MKKLITLLLFAITSMVAAAQTPHTDAYLKNYTDSLIRRVTMTSKNVANTYQLGWDSKVSILAPRLGTTSTVGYVWMATNTSGNGSWQQINWEDFTVNGGTFDFSALSGAQTYSFPDNSGTIALTSDIETVTGSNGITKVGSDFQLGGTLTSDITIDGSTTRNVAFNTNNFTITGNGDVIINGSNSGQLKSGSHNMSVTPSSIFLSHGSQVISAIGGVGKFTVTGTAATLASGVKLTPTPSSTTSGLNWGSLAGNPSSLANADAWYNSSTNRFMGRQNATTDVFVMEALSQTLTNKTISGASNTITNVSLTTGVTGILPGANGGTGVANTGKTLTLSGNTTIGSSTNTVTFTTSGNTSLALPTSGTLVVAGTTLAAYGITDAWKTSGTTNISGSTVISTGANTVQFFSNDGTNTVTESIGTGNFQFTTKVNANANTTADWVLGTLGFTVKTYNVSTGAVLLQWDMFDDRFKLTDGRGSPQGMTYAATGYVTTANSLTDRDYVLNVAKTFTSKQTMQSSNFAINNPANTFAYNFVGSAIAANRNVTIPLLAGNDVLVMEAFTQTLTNKTISGTNNTITDVSLLGSTVTLGNGLTGSTRSITSAGSSTDIDLQIVAKNAGKIELSTNGVIPFSVNGNMHVNVGQSQASTRMLNVYENFASTSTVEYLQRLTRVTNSTAANGIGVGIEYVVETAPSNDQIAALMEIVATDVTNASEDFDIVFKTMSGGSPASNAERFRISADKITATFAGVPNNLTNIEFINETTTSRTLSESDRGRLIYIKNAGSTAIRLPNGMTPGYSVTFWMYEGSGTATISATTTLRTPGGATQMINDRESCLCWHEGSNIWNCKGDLH